MSRRWRVLLLNTKMCDGNYYISVAIKDALQKHPAVECVHPTSYPDALNLAVRHRCNLLLAYEGEELDRGLCARLAAVCGRSAIWMTEDPWLSPQTAPAATLFDLVFTNDSSAVSAYPRGAVHLPLAASTLFHRFPVPEKDEGHYLYDVEFMGGAWVNRVQFLKDVLGQLPGVKAKLALSHHDYLPSWEWKLTGGGYTWDVPRSEPARHMARFANRSRVTLTLHRIVGGCERVSATPGPRLFEAALAGGFQLVDLALPEVARYFDVGTEIDGFRSADECAAKIRHYLDNPEQRLTLARAAQRRCLAEHLYEHRVARLLAALEAAEPRPARPGRAAGPRPAAARVLHVVSAPATTGRAGAGPAWGLEHLTCHLAPPPAANGPGAGAPPRVGEVTLPPDRPGDALVDREREMMFGHILHRERVDLVHFHGLPERPASLPLVARTLGLPTVISHRAAAGGPDGAGNGVPPGPEEGRRRNFVGAVLQNADALLFAGERDRQDLERQFPTVGRHGNAQVVGAAGAVERLYASVLEEYRVRERGEAFFAQEPLPREASAFNVYRTSEMEAPPAPAPVAAAPPAAPRLSNLLPYWRQQGTRRTLAYVGRVAWARTLGRLIAR
jgi:hypothetical protein